MAPTSSSKSTSKIGRNDPCECNSGKKAKACCGEKRAEKPAASLPTSVANLELLYPSQTTIDGYEESRKEKARKLAVDLFRGIEKKIQVHTCKSEECATKWKAFVQINMPGGTPLVMFPPKGEQKSRIESLEKLVEKLGEAVEKKEMDELRSAMEARDQASEG